MVSARAACSASPYHPSSDPPGDDHARRTSTWQPRRGTHGPWSPRWPRISESGNQVRSLVREAIEEASQPPAGTRVVVCHGLVLCCRSINPRSDQAMLVDREGREVKPFPKYQLSSSECESHPAKAEPGRLVASPCCGPGNGAVNAYDRERVGRGVAAPKAKSFR